MLCLNCKSTTLCHNSDCSCSWPQAQTESHKHQSTSLPISSLPTIILKCFKKQETNCTQNRVFLKCNHTEHSKSCRPWQELVWSLARGPSLTACSTAQLRGTCASEITRMFSTSSRLYCSDRMLKIGGEGKKNPRFWFTIYSTVEKGK